MTATTEHKARRECSRAQYVKFSKTLLRLVLEDLKLRGAWANTLDALGAPFHMSEEKLHKELGKRIDEVLKLVP